MSDYDDGDDAAMPPRTPLEWLEADPGRVNAIEDAYWAMKEVLREAGHQDLLAELDLGTFEELVTLYTPGVPGFRSCWGRTDPA